MRRAEKKPQQQQTPAPRRVENRQLTADQSLMDSIQSEISQESRPLMQFITANAKYLVAIIVVLIAALVGTGVYGHYKSSRQESVLESLARTMQRPADAGQLAELEAAGRDAPDFMRTAVDVDLVSSAVAQGEREKAAEAYGRVAKAQDGSPMGLVAALNQAGSLLGAGKYQEGAALLQALLPGLTPRAAVQPRTMLAEAAARAGDYELAARTYDELAGQAEQDLDRQYCAARAEDLRARARGEREAAASETAN